MPSSCPNGSFRGLVPKQFLPNYKEFYEQRWFSPATGREPKTVDLGGQTVPFGIDLLFEAGAGSGVVVGVEICEDLWMPIPPSSLQALAGATILLNPSASNETVGKSRYRTDLVVGQSGRCVAAYAYAGAGPSESTTDVVFAGHCLIAENGRLLAESRRVGDGKPLVRGSYWVTTDVDVEKLATDRRTTTSFDDGARPMPEFRRDPVRPRADDAGPEAIRDRHAVRAARGVGAARAIAPRSSGSSARGWPSGSSSFRRARRSTSASRAVWIRRSRCSWRSRPATRSACLASSSAA